MSNKGEDVKQLFAHLGLDPSSYRDLKGEGDKDEVEGRVGKKRTAPAKPDEPVVDPDAYPPPPRVQQAESAPVPEEPVGSAAPEAVPEPAPTRTEPVVDEIVEPEAEPEAEELALVDAMPDRWSLLASLGQQEFPVADIPEEPAELGEWSQAVPGGVSEEQDTPRLRRAGSLAALVRGTERVAQSARQLVSGDDDDTDEAPGPVSEQTPEVQAAPAAAAHRSAPLKSESIPAAEGAAMNSSSEAREASDSEESSAQPARPTSGAIAKLMGRLGQPPAQRRPDGAKLKLHYERRQAPVVAETHLDQSLPSVFGRLEKSSRLSRNNYPNSRKRNKDIRGLCRGSRTSGPSALPSCRPRAA